MRSCPGVFRGNRGTHAPVASRLAICDDAPGFRLLVETIFTEAGFEIAGTATSWEEAERLVADTVPDVVLLDLWLPTFDRDAIARIAAATDGALIAVVSSLGRDEARDMVQGIDGIGLVLSKRDPPETLAVAVRETLG